MDNKKKLIETIHFIRTKTNIKPKCAIILGSGLGDFAEYLENKDVIQNSDIPHYPKSTVVGHKGKLVFGFLNKKPILAFQGRIHYYETGDLNTILYPILVAHRLGIRKIILTNAAGGVNRNFHPGDLMLIKDHINLTFETAYSVLQESKYSLKGYVYDKDLIKTAVDIADEKNIPLREGIYVGVKGPSYETASEIEMIRRIGGDAVGMSTVNEATLASLLGMKVIGISCITNYATGVTNLKLSHAEVTEVANKVKHRFSELIKAIFFKIC
ncbi:MAG: Purine nucleoside phosphorylase [Ignavibacteriae bacterium]|nr:MAG: Purine nucleoside phosphorylase [Ignavibacteriota bacterium]